MMAAVAGRLWFAGAALALAAFSAAPAGAASLMQIRARGTLGVCAHPNSLPFASKTAQPPGFQIELGRAIAAQLGVDLAMDWIVSPRQIRPAECDIVLDTIADPEAQSEIGLTLSKPYYRSGVSLAVPKASAIRSMADLDGHTKVGVMVGSIAAMLLNQRHVATSTFGFEDEMLEALAQGEIAAAAVTPISAEYFNQLSNAAPVRLLPMQQISPDLAWNVAVGMRKPDDALRAAINEALDKLGADGTIARIYAEYGITLQPPK